MRKLWILLTYLVFAVLLVAPLAKMVQSAFSNGWTGFAQSISRPEALHALMMTGLVVLCVTVLNGIFGIMTALYLVRGKWLGRRLRSVMNSIVDLPYAVSPVIGGLMIVLLVGPDTAIGAFFEKIGVNIVYAFPGMVIATLFVTFPLMVREIMPVLEEIGDDQEQASATLGLRLDDVPPRDLAVDPLGRRLRGGADGRALDGRVRRGARRLGQHHQPDADGDDARVPGRGKFQYRGGRRACAGSGGVLGGPAAAHGMDEEKKGSALGCSMWRFAGWTNILAVSMR